MKKWIWSIERSLQCVGRSRDNVGLAAFAFAAAPLPRPLRSVALPGNWECPLLEGYDISVPSPDPSLRLDISVIVRLEDNENTVPSRRYGVTSCYMMLLSVLSPLSHELFMITYYECWSPYVCTLAGLPLNLDRPLRRTVSKCLIWSITSVHFSQHWQLALKESERLERFPNSESVCWNSRSSSSSFCESWGLTHLFFSCLSLISGFRRVYYLKKFG